MNFDNYCVSDLKDIPIMLPEIGRPFRVHVSEMKRDILLILSKGYGWCLVDCKVAKEQRSSKVNISDLFYGVYENGDVFIIPVTRCFDGRGNSYSHSLLKMIEVAKHEWVIREDAMNELHHYHLAGGVQRPYWSINFEASLNIAFTDRVIDSTDDFIKAVGDRNTYGRHY